MAGLAEPSLAKVRALLADGKARGALAELANLGENAVLRDARLLACRVWARLEAGDELRAAHDLLRLLDTAGIANLPEDIGPGGLGGLLGAFGPEGKRTLGGALGRWALARKLPIADVERVLQFFPLTDWPLELLLESVERAAASPEGLDANARARLQYMQRTAPADARVAALHARLIGSPGEIGRRRQDEARRAREATPIHPVALGSAVGAELPAAFLWAWAAGAGDENARGLARKRGARAISGAELFPLTQGGVERINALAAEIAPPGAKVVPFGRVRNGVLALLVSSARPGDGDFPVLLIRDGKVEVLASTTAEWLARQ